MKNPTGGSAKPCWVLLTRALEPQEQDISMMLHINYKFMSVVWVEKIKPKLWNALTAGQQRSHLNGSKMLTRHQSHWDLEILMAWDSVTWQDMAAKQIGMGQDFASNLGPQ